MSLIETVKRNVKLILTFLYHPILSLKIGGGKNLILGKKLRINTTKYLSIGKDVTICNNARLLFVDDYKGGQYTPNVIIGNNVFITFNFTLMAAAPIVIHDHVLIASDVMISSENHGMDPEHSLSYADTPLDGKPVEIGEGCWLGEKSMIMPGVVLGKRCIVAAGAVVTKSFPDYSLVAGVPAKCIKTYNLNKHQWEKSN